MKNQRSGTATGTQNQKIRDSGPGPGLKIEKSGIGDWDRDSDLRAVQGTKEFWDSVPGTENFPGHGPCPEPTPDPNSKLT